MISIAMKCKCRNKEHDKVYGKGRRAFIREANTKDPWRCSNCGRKAKNE